VSGGRWSRDAAREAWIYLLTARFAVRIEDEDGEPFEAVPEFSERVRDLSVAVWNPPAKRPPPPAVLEEIKALRALLDHHEEQQLEAAGAVLPARVARQELDLAAAVVRESALPQP
jgi:hypothetical protein